MHAARIPGRLSSCPLSLPLSISLRTPLFLRSPSMRRGQIYEGRGWHTSTHIYIYICVRARVCVCSKRDEAESGGTGGELCVELIRASLKVSRSKFPPPSSFLLLPRPPRSLVSAGSIRGVVVGPARVSRLEIATRSVKYHGKDANEPFGNRATNRSAAN